MKHLIIIDGCYLVVSDWTGDDGMVENGAWELFICPPNRMKCEQDGRWREYASLDVHLIPAKWENLHYNDIIDNMKEAVKAMNDAYDNADSLHENRRPEWAEPLISVKTLRVRKKEDIPKDWTKSVLWLWEEDDAPVPDKESVEAAFERITKVQNQKSFISKHDDDDCFTYFYRGGWIKQVACDGARVGVLVEVEFDD